MRVARLKNKAWFFGGAALGLAIPFGMRVYERLLMLGDVRPVVQWLFWPTSLFSLFRHPSTVSGEAILFAFAALSNALLYGLLAKVLRRASIVIVLFVLIAVWISLPPSATRIRTISADGK